MLERASLVIRGRGEATKKRQQIDILLKKATKGDGRAKLKLYKEFGIKLYSAGEVERYVQTRMPQEYAPSDKGPSNGPAGLARKMGVKGLCKDRVRQTRSLSSPSRTQSKKRKTVGRKT
jgi:hypothetical protein